MNDTLGLVIPICALSLVCVGLLAVIAVIAVRFLGFAVPGWIGHYTEILGGKAERTSILPPETARRQRPDFRSQAVDLDFDAAVARHQANKDRPRPSGTPPAIGAQSVPPLPDSPNPTLRRRKRPQEGYSQDEIHGGLLDEDGDGDVDF